MSFYRLNNQIPDRLIDHENNCDFWFHTELSFGLLGDTLKFLCFECLFAKHYINWYQLTELVEKKEFRHKNRRDIMYLKPLHWCLTWKSTGRVVGILQRNWRDYVVTFPPRDATQSQSRNSQRILAVPWDRRIPKIRISTQQAEALQVCLHVTLIYLLRNSFD